MHFKKLILPILLIATILTSPLCARKAYAIVADVTNINNRAYYSAVIEAIYNAKYEVYVAMYSMYIHGGEPNKPAHKLVRALIDAHQRGVKVTVYLDKAATGKNIKRLPKGNDVAYALLRDYGVNVTFIKPELKLHAKLIVIDGSVVIEGSSNWTDKAVIDNAETNTLTRSGVFAAEKLKFFDYLKINTTQGNLRRELTMKVKVPNSFLYDLAGSMLREKSEHAFDLYLLLIRNGQKPEAKEWQLVPYNNAAVELDIPIDNKYFEHRDKIRFAAKQLKEKYHLIDYRFNVANALEAKVLEPLPQSRYFNIPLAYWEYGLNNNLRTNEKFFYLISLHEGELVAPKPYWRRSIPGLMEKYHMNNAFFSRAITGLRRADLLEVQYDSLKGWGREASRSPNQYRLKQLISPAEKEAMWTELLAIYGKEDLYTVRILLDSIDMSNNVPAAREIFSLIEECGIARVKAAFAKVSKFEPSNPIRGIDYIRALARKAVRESK